MNDKEEVRHCQWVLEIEEEVASPDEVWNLENKPTNARRKVYASQRVGKSAIIDFDPRQNKPS